MPELRMPALGADMAAGTLVAYRAKPGDALKRGDIAAEVETDKGVIEIEVYVPGVLERWLVDLGAKVPVGTPLALLRDAGAPAGETSAPPGPAPSPTAAPAARVDTPRLAPVSNQPTARAAPRATPAARKRAHELGVDLTTVEGTRGGAITLDDVERAAQRTAAAAPPQPSAAAVASTDRQRALRRAIAASMARAKREIPHYYVSTTVDLGTASAWLSARNAERSVRERMLMGTLLLKASALAAKGRPELNSLWDGEQGVPCPNVHLGVAIALRGGGLIAPAIHDADRLALPELMTALQDLVARARTGALRSSELSDGTITVTSLGERGVESVFPIIYPPQTAIIGFGRVVERPWAVQGMLAVRPVVTVTLAADHRVTDGHLGARFLASIDALLQEPNAL